MHTPVLYCVFNRPEVVEKTFQPIKEAKPERLYIAADGPRKEKRGEKELTEKTRKYILDNIDWDCEIFTLFQEENIGCEKSIYGAIKWMFKKEETGIILEDDIMTNPSFFTFMELMLDKYKNDEKITIVSGYNPLKPFSKNDVEFLPYAQTLGFGTFKRIIDQFEFNPEKSLYSPKETEKLYTDCLKENLGKALNSFYKDIHQWDIEFYKLLYSLFQKGQYAAASKYNLTQCLPSVGYHTNNDVEQYIKQYEIDFKNFKIPEKFECSEEYADCYIGVHIYRYIFNKYGFRPDLKGIREDIKKEKRFLNKLMFKNSLPFQKKSKKEERKEKIKETKRQIVYKTNFLELITKYPDLGEIIEKPIGSKVG